MAQTRLQKLSLLREALITVTKQLFSEYTGSVEVKISFYDGSPELMDEGLSEGYVYKDAQGTEWVSKDYITIFKK